MESLSAIIGSEEPNESLGESNEPTNTEPGPLLPFTNVQNSPNVSTVATSTSTTTTPVLLNGTTLATPSKNEKGLPKAMVKPSVVSNVLTHVIEGFVIQEANEPFPVTRQRYAEIDEDEPPSKLNCYRQIVRCS